MKFIRSLSLSLACILIIGSAIAAYVLYFGVYNVSALQQHTGIVFELLEYARVRSISVHSKRDVPDLESTDWKHSGLVLYTAHCQQCHGAPGIAPDSFSLGMLPAPSPIIKIARSRPPEEIFWAITHGVKMSGMPAWKYRLSEKERRQLVALIINMASLTTREYANLLEDATHLAVAKSHPAPEFSIQNQKERLKLGRIALQQYNCSGCHEIPGITAAATHVGPSLKKIEKQVFLVGLLPMNAHNLKQWIRFPQAIKPGTAMPSMDVPEEHAELMIEYLLSDTVNPQ